MLACSLHNRGNSLNQHFIGNVVTLCTLPIRWHLRLSPQLWRELAAFRSTGHHCKRKMSTHFSWHCHFTAAGEREMCRSQSLIIFLSSRNHFKDLTFSSASTMVPCGPECWPAPFTTVATVSIAILLAMCIVVTTFGNLLVLVSFVVERQIRHGYLNIWTWKSNIALGKPQRFYCSGL